MTVSVKLTIRPTMLSQTHEGHELEAWPLGPFGSASVIATSWEIPTGRKNIIYSFERLRPMRAARRDEKILKGIPVRECTNHPVF